MIGRIALRVQGLGFAYGSGEHAYSFDQWDAEFPRGSITAITGPSGCGKSTRLYLLALMLRPNRGTIELAGRRVDHLPDAERSALRAREFGFVFQDASLDASRSVLDNILESALYRGEQPREWRTRAFDLMAALGVEVAPGRRPGEVSGGQGQRIATCRALLASPRVVLADEPTGNLDQHSAEAVLDALRGHAESGGCVIVVTHDQRIAAWADHHLHVGVSS